MDQTPKTLLETIEEELLRMLSRNMPHSPSAGELPASAKTMFEDLYRIGLRDESSERVRESLNLIGRAGNSWPTPYDVIQCLPSKKEPQHCQLEQTESKEAKEERRERGFEQLAKIRKTLTESLVVGGRSRND